ncbi:potassium channel family protein [Ilumatobacter sp.]|uniref:potassium channel family protein n=1 Tax=Ilumatobacter sp. TaxID=1967498 RepID=UPI003C337358
MIAGVAVLVAVGALATTGYVVAGWTLGDALYMVVITVFAVGYGEVQPITSWPLRGLTVTLIVAGYGAVIYTVGGFIQLVVDGELNRALGARRMTRDIDQLDGHTIICGYGRMGTTLARELQAAGQPFVAIDTLGGASPLADEDDGILVIHGDATEEDVLERAGIRRAAVLATVLSDDAANVFVTLTAREMNPDLTIIARGEDRRTESKLRNCGADTVVMTTTIGAAKMSQLILRPTADQLLDQLTTRSEGGPDLDHIGLRFDEFLIEGSSPLALKTLAEIEVSGAHGYLIVGIRGVDGTTIMHPPQTTTLSIGDVVVVLGYNDDIPHFATRPPARRSPKTTTYRGLTTTT